MRIVTLIILLLLIAIPGQAQVSHGGTPVGLSDSGLKTLAQSKVKLPEIRTVLKSASVNKDEIHHKTLKFAQTFDVKLNPENSGSWTTLNDGSRVWRLLINSEGAKTINVIFSRFRLPDGAKLFLYNPEMTHVLGSFTSANNKNRGIFPVMPVDGDKLIVEYHEPVNVTFNAELEISKINHDYLGINNVLKDVPIGNFGSSQDCEVNIGCEEGWDIQAQSVVKMIIDGNELCTGTLINNTAEDGTPFILTAAHCYTDHSFRATGTIFIFNYQVPGCYNEIEGSREQSVAGGIMRAYSEQEEFKNSDYALVEMSIEPPASYRPYYSGWDASVTLDSNVVSIHHPNGDVKKISHDVDEVEITSLIVSDYYYKTYSHWWIKDWETGVTEGGSSGCPLYDRNGLIIGALSAGQASCINTINDFYYSLSKVWTSHSDQTRTLEYWLDPIGSGLKKLEGYYPENYENISRMSNVQSGEEIDVLRLGEGGYLGGFNSTGITQYAEHYQLENDDTSQILGIYLVPQLGSSSSATNINFKVWKGGTVPGAEVWSKNIKVKEWLRTQKVDGTISTYGDYGGYYTKAYYDDKENFIDISEDVFPGNDFYIGYEIVNNGPVDTFALYAVHDRGDTGDNTAYYYKDGAWSTFPNFIQYPVNTSLFMDPVVKTFSQVTDTGVVTKSTKIVSFIEPSPSIGDYFTLHFSEPLQENASLSIFTLNGVKVGEYSIYSGSTSFDQNFTDSAGGIYIIRITYLDKHEVYRVVNLSK